MTVGFLITSPYQVFHYKRIAAHLPDVVAIGEARTTGFGLTDEFVAAHLPDRPIEWIAEDKLSDLDGRFTVIVCQTPILPLRFPERSLVVAQQYSLAKERYQYGVWRTHADLNLMYGPASTAAVSGFCRAVAVGNPLFDDVSRPVRSGAFPTDRAPRLLYAPTYGELSSLRDVLPALARVDATVTLKLHHAQDRDSIGALPSGIDVVYSDTDPAELLARHDGVLSDLSGAAADALYAGLPVVLTGEVDPNGRDYARLSRAERSGEALAGLVGAWQPGDDLLAAFADAEAALRTPRYEEFLARTYSNPQTAGKAAADAIAALIADGPGEHFAADQVRETTRRYILRNRRLARPAADASATATPAEGIVGPPDRRLSYLYRRTRAELAQIGPLRRAVQWRRDRARAAREPDPATITGVVEPRPAHRREQVWTTIAPALAAAGVIVARDSAAPGAPAAIRAEDKKALWRALRALAAPKLYVRTGVEQRPSQLHPLSALTWHEVLAADWLDVGALTRRATVQNDMSGLLRIDVVAHHPERNRYLATRTIPDRADWTSLFTSAAPGSVAVGSRRAHPAAPVDVVYTWVDSRDPKWRDRQRHWAEREGSTLVSADNEERFIDRDELRHSLRALWMFAPWVRNIYIVTADQRPAWLADDERVRVVSHREIFPDVDALPTFNSHAIESCLHRIPGLAENFLYFNDDVFLGRETTEADFFTIAGMAKVRLSPSQYVYDGEPEPGAIPTDWAAYHSARLVERDFGLRFDRRLKHVPLPLNRTVLAEIEERYPQEIARTRGARFRSRDDVALPSMLAQYYAMATNRAVEWHDPKRSYVYLDTGKHDSLNRFGWIADWRPMFYCLNVTRFTQVNLAEQARNLAAFYRRVLPHPAPWEMAPVPAPARGGSERVAVRS